MLAILEDHRSSSGLSKFHCSDKAARFFCSSSGVSVPYVNMASGVTSLNPRSGSLRAPRKEAVTSDKMWDFNAAHKLLYEVTLLRAAA